ncbi:MAG: glycosyltransferase [Candidatus Eremiobacteraeota bacterium]|nr:glycosyltransferase [Candidatus Eremiobacteraeota bacterium]
MVVIPVYNDWESVAILLKKLDDTFAGEGISAEVLLVDDGSSLASGAFFTKDTTYYALEQVDILRLNRNLGHQRALAIALSFVSERKDYTSVVVMDGDGEDDPAEVPKLIAEQKAAAGETILFAARGKRSEGLHFKIFYHLFKKIYFLLTGTALSFGNFSVIPRKALERLVNVAELWNNYPASVIKARFPYRTVKTARGRRYRGSSQMNFVSLMLHGLSAISVHGEIIGIRALIAMLIVALLSFLAIIIVIFIRLCTDLAIPGWASYLAATFSVILLQSLTMTMFFVFMILHSRNLACFLPKREYQSFILARETLFRK